MYRPASGGVGGGAAAGGVGGTQPGGGKRHGRPMHTANSFHPADTNHNGRIGLREAARYARIEKREGLPPHGPPNPPHPPRPGGEHGVMQRGTLTDGKKHPPAAGAFEGVELLGHPAGGGDSRAAGPDRRERGEISFA